jgi:hypothetical protein
MPSARRLVGGAGLCADSADNTIWTADGGALVGATDATDALVNADIVYADVYEPVGGIVTADSTNYTADSTIWTADGGVIGGATDTTDAEAVSLPVFGGGGFYYPPRRQR